MKTNHKDVHQEVTDQIVAQLEAGAAEFELPWHRSGSVIHRPVNVVSKNAYRGINVVSLWLSAFSRDFTHGLWGTYRQWQEKGAQVRKGEKSSTIVFYKEIDIKQEDLETGEDEYETRLFARASRVFNVAQVDGYEIPSEDLPNTTLPPIPDAELFVQSTGAKIEVGGDRAFYRTTTDHIQMPDWKRFAGTSTSSPTDAWYATLMHELTHWSGAEHRLDRDLKNRFDSEAYAMEELVAELGAAFLCADLGLTQEPRPDHASYLANWLKVLKEDKKAIFTAASQADKASTWLLRHTGMRR